MALIRTEKRDEATPLLNSLDQEIKEGKYDDNTLQALIHCFKVKLPFLSFLTGVVVIYHIKLHSSCQKFWGVETITLSGMRINENLM